MNGKNEEMKQFNNVDTIETKSISLLMVKQEDLHSILDLKAEVDDNLLYDETKPNSQQCSIKMPIVQTNSISQLDTIIKCETFATKSEEDLECEAGNDDIKLEPEEVYLNEECNSDLNNEDKCANNYTTYGKHFKCSLCSFIAKYRSTMRIHQLCHSGEKPYECGICNCRYTRITPLKKHILRAHTKKPFTCTACNHNFDSNTFFDLHVKTHIIKLPKCTKCDYSCKDASEMERHKVIHAVDKVFQCDQCYYKGTMKALASHKQFHMGSKKEYVCKPCFFSTSRKCYFKRHMETHTSNQKLYRCDQCIYRSNNIALLVAHMKSHREGKI